MLPLQMLGLGMRPYARWIRSNRYGVVPGMI
jgi:hypothetical protein